MKTRCHTYVECSYEESHEIRHRDQATGDVHTSSHSRREVSCLNRIEDEEDEEGAGARYAWGRAWDAWYALYLYALVWDAGYALYLYALVALLF